MGEHMTTKHTPITILDAFENIGEAPYYLMTEGDRLIEIERLAIEQEAIEDEES